MVQVHTHAAGATGELFLDLENLELVEVPSTVLGGHIETIEVVLLGELIELIRENVGDLDLLLHLLERALGQLANLLQICLELLVGNLCIRVHAGLLSRACDACT